MGYYLPPRAENSNEIVTKVTYVIYRLISPKWDIFYGWPPPIR
jgi:hypothetical protein